MPFQKGNKLSPGGKKGGKGGRPSKEKKEIQKAAAEIAREYIERSIKPVLHTYFQLAHGRLVNKYHEGQVVNQEFEADAPTTRHFIDKLMPASKQEVDVNVHGQVQVFTNVDPYAGRAKKG